MRRRLLMSLAMLCGLLIVPASNAEAQGTFRTDHTFFIKPRVGLAHYHGDLIENFTFAFDKGIPYSAGLEVGYQISTQFSIGGQSSYARYSALDPHPGEDTDRFTHQLIVRWTGSARTAPVAPFIQVGIHVSDGLDELALGPAVGFGVDIALSDQVYLFLEAMTNFSSPDDAFDGDEADAPGFDFVSYVGPGLKINLGRPFTAADVRSLECPDRVETGKPVTVVEPPVPAEIVTLEADETRFEICAPITVEFQPDVRGEEPLTYRWDFGDGSRGVGADAEHTYTLPGTYTVTLTVLNPHGRATRSMTISAEPCTAGVCFDITDMNSVFFGRNASTLTGDGRGSLRSNLEVLTACPNLCARIEGFAAPGERNPQALSAGRVVAVEDFYVNNGIPLSRIVTEARGQAGETTSMKAGASRIRRVDTIPLQCEELD